MTEIEVKILDIDPKGIEHKLESLGAVKLSESRLIVDWFWEPGTKLGEEPWFLRVRSYSGGKVEITWKAKSEKLRVARKHNEINFTVGSHETVKEFFEAIGFVCYAHQEKDRSSWKLGQAQVDIDQYPHMPAYLEIEAENQQVIEKTIEQLELQNHNKSLEGERLLITDTYKLNWFDMKFQ